MTWNFNVRRTDIGVDCGSFRGDALHAAEPRVLIELLAPQTLDYERFRKLEDYKATEAVRVILLVDAEQPRVAVWRRSDDGWSHREEAGLEAAIELPEIGARLELADLYGGVVFDG